MSGIPCQLGALFSLSGCAVGDCVMAAAAVDAEMAVVPEGPGPGPAGATVSGEDSAAGADTGRSHGERSRL